MSSVDALSIHPTLKLIFPKEYSADLKAHDDEKEELNADTAWHYYSHSIRRNPADLTLHTHRVFFAMQHKDAILLPGSLHDLFYVLKDAGEKLRIRLLKASLPYLSRQDTLYFAMWIKTGIKKGMGYQWVNGSVLSDGLYGPDQDLITMIANENEEYKLSPLEEARSCMELGQLDVAQKVLHDALALDADNKMLNEELDYLNNYIKSREIDPPKEVTKSSGFGSALGKIKDKIFS
ncbi:MAG: hypothetical protein V7749_14685 [Cocleimonas sp.]